MIKEITLVLSGRSVAFSELCNQLKTLATCSNQSEQTRNFINQSKTNQNHSSFDFRTFFSACEQLNVFPRLATVELFPALGNGCMFSRAGNSSMFFREWHQFNLFPHMAPVVCLCLEFYRFIFKCDYFGFDLMTAVVKLFSFDALTKQCHIPSEV